MFIRELWSRVCWAPDDGEGGEPAPTDPAPGTEPGVGEGSPPAADPEPGEGAGEGEAKVSAPAPAPEPVKPDWRERRIAQLTARLRAAEEKAKAPAPTPPAGGNQDADIERLA